MLVWTETNLVAVGLRRQLLVQRSHVGCQSLESIPDFVLLSSRNTFISQGEKSSADPSAVCLHAWRRSLPPQAALPAA